MPEQVGSTGLSRLGEIGPWIISFLALVQVWIIAMWRKLRRANLHIYESGTIEIGYGSFGPSVSLTGTLRGLHKDIFVQNISVHIVRLRDSAQHLFSWKAFRPNTISLSGQGNQEVEIAASFMLLTSQPYRYNVFFVDDKFVAEYRGKVEPVAQKWQDFLRERLSSLKQQEGSKEPIVQNAEALAGALLGDFMKHPDVLDAYQVLDRAFYWESGKYSLVLGVKCSQPDQVFSKSWHFELSEDDAQRLRHNSLLLLQSLCGLTVKYNFAYPQYESEL